MSKNSELEALESVRDEALRRKQAAIRAKVIAESEWCFAKNEQLAAEEIGNDAYAELYEYRKYLLLLLGKGYKSRFKSLQKEVNELFPKAFPEADSDTMRHIGAREKYHQRRAQLDQIHADIGPLLDKLKTYESAYKEAKKAINTAATSHNKALEEFNQAYTAAERASKEYDSAVRDLIQAQAKYSSPKSP